MLPIISASVIGSLKVREVVIEQICHFTQTSTFNTNGHSAGAAVTAAVMVFSNHFILYRAYSTMPLSLAKVRMVSSAAKGG